MGGGEGEGLINLWGEGRGRGCSTYGGRGGGGVDQPMGGGEGEGLINLWGEGSYN